jgi:hypothetical protein
MQARRIEGRHPATYLLSTTFSEWYRSRGKHQDTQSRLSSSSEPEVDYRPRAQLINAGHSGKTCYFVGKAGGHGAIYHPLQTLSSA